MDMGGTQEKKEAGTEEDRSCLIVGCVTAVKACRQLTAEIDKGGPREVVKVKVNGPKVRRVSVSILFGDCLRSALRCSSVCRPRVRFRQLDLDLGHDFLTPTGGSAYVHWRTIYLERRRGRNEQ
jgi:hypothetical protein